MSHEFLWKAFVMLPVQTLCLTGMQLVSLVVVAVLIHWLASCPKQFSMDLAAVIASVIQYLEKSMELKRKQVFRWLYCWTMFAAYSISIGSRLTKAIFFIIQGIEVHFRKCCHYLKILCFIQNRQPLTKILFEPCGEKTNLGKCFTRQVNQHHRKRNPTL